MNRPESTTEPASRWIERVVPFQSGDGFQCNLINVRAPKPPAKGPVLLVHGAGVRANIFRAPVKTSIVDYLVERGYDVWLENWRASIDFRFNPWTLDQAALYDHPYAVRTIVQETGRADIKAIIHCQGSTSFTMSALAGLVPEVKTIVSNAVSLHTVVPTFSVLKLNFALPLIRRVSPCLNPQWGLQAPTLASKVISCCVALVHHECHNPVCKQVSFTYGSGFPALWLHENLNGATHDWVKCEFAAVPMTFFDQMSRCVRRGNLVSLPGPPACRRISQPRRPKPTRDFPFLPAPATSASCRKASGGPLIFSTPGARTITLSTSSKTTATWTFSWGIERPRTCFRGWWPSWKKRARPMAIPQRIRNYTGRYSLVDGIPFQMPVRCQKSPVLMAIFTIDADKAAKLIPGNEVFPFRLWSRGLLVITVIDYLKTNIGKYIEFSIAIACTHGKGPAPRLLPVAFQKHFGLGQYVYDLPVSTEISVKGGKGIWGMPKHQANLNYIVGPDKVSSQYELEANSE